jgi:hypothetical protein
MTRRAIPFLLIWLAALPAHADEPQSFAVTTDTPQYCTQLAKQVSDRHSLIPDVQRLLETGTDMCAKGEIRGGIRRLRHALIILHHHRPAKELLGRDQAPKTAAAKEAAPKTAAQKTVAPPPKTPDPVTIPPQ